MSERSRKSSAKHLEVHDDEAARRGRRRPSTQSTKSNTLAVRPSSTGRRVSSPGLSSDGKVELSVETGYASGSRRSSVFAGSSGRTSLDSSVWTSQDRDTDDQNVERSPTSKIEEAKSEDGNLETAAEVVKSEETVAKSPDKSEEPQQAPEPTKMQTILHTTTKHFMPQTVQYAHLEQSQSVESASLDSGDEKTAAKPKASTKEIKPSKNVKPSKSPKQSKMSTLSETATGARPRVSRSTRDKSTSTSPKKSNVKTPGRKPGSLPTPSKKETPYNLRPKKPTVEESSKVSDLKGKVEKVLGRSRSKSKTPKKEEIPTSAKSPDVVVYKPATSRRVVRQVDLSPPIRLKSVEIKGKPKLKKEKSPKKPPPDTAHIRPTSATLLLDLKKMELHDKDDSASEPLIDALEICPPDDENKEVSDKQEMVKPPDYFFPRNPAQVGRFMHDDPDCVSPDSSPDIEDLTTESSRVMDSEMATASRDPLKDSGVSSHTPSQVSSFEEDPAAEASGLEEDSALKPKLQRQKRMKEQSSSGSDEDEYKAISPSPLKRPSHTPKEENKE